MKPCGPVDNPTPTRFLDPIDYFIIPAPFIFVYKSSWELESRSSGVFSMEKNRELAENFLD
jgi:hypothetical protein